jgi:hypothetical protein
MVLQRPIELAIHLGRVDDATRGLDLFGASYRAVVYVGAGGFVFEDIGGENGSDRGGDRRRFRLARRYPSSALAGRSAARAQASYTHRPPIIVRPGFTPVKLMGSIVIRS